MLNFSNIYERMSSLNTVSNTLIKKLQHGLTHKFSENKINYIFNAKKKTLEKSALLQT